MALERMDKFTYLYMRNGERLYRLETAIRFEHQLFPDVDEREKLTGKLWAAVSGIVDENDAVRYSSRDEDDDDFDDSSKVANLISDREYQGMIEEDNRAYAEWKNVREHTWRTGHSDHYELFNRDNVFYDDISNYIQRQIAAHNRLVLVLQGILDRSPVMHPHPPWVLWNEDSFVQALELVYDLGRALVSGDAPDFEAYRAKCNESIVPGTVVIGQDRVWRGRDEDDWEDNYRERRRREQRYRNIEDPGPGKFAHVAKINRKKACVFEWVRTQSFWRDHEQHERQFATRIAVPKEKLFNVEAYQPGDFKLFFNDPRTREQYLRWAPLLLEAEEYKAGNRKVRPIEKMPAPKTRTPGGSWEYRERKRKLALVGLAFELARDVRMSNKKTVYKKGSLWRIRSCFGREFYVDGIKRDGKPDGDRAISNLSERDFVWRPDIPRKEKK
jgi:hypothetical protein